MPRNPELKLPPPASEVHAGAASAAPAAPTVTVDARIVLMVVDYFRPQACPWHVQEAMRHLGLAAERVGGRGAPAGRGG
jgi:hypothetical protein